MGTYRLNRLQGGSRCIRTGYQEVATGDREEVEAAFRLFHEIPDEEEIDVQEIHKEVEK